MSLACVFLSAQEATDIYLFDLSEQDNSITIKNPVNISKNNGYDNQPCFTEDGTAILFASFRDGQSDVAKYFIDEKYKVWLTQTEESEFSPMPVPGKKKYFTCVRSNLDGTQFLYKYNYRNKPPELLIPNIKVGYYLWFNSKVLVSFVIDDVETLQVSNFKYKIKYPIQSYIGRSIHKIPESSGLGQDQISFISLSHESPEIYAINPLNSESKYITDALPGSQDLTWTTQGSILMGKGDMIYKFRPDMDESWQPIQIESEFPIEGITRLALSPDGKKLAVVVRESAE
jgi:hypothetical protein